MEPVVSSFQGAWYNCCGASEAAVHINFLHRKNLDLLDCVRLQLDHNASRTCNHNVLRRWIHNDTFCTSSFAQASLLFVFYSFWEWYSWEAYQNFLDAKAQQSLSVDVLVSVECTILFMSRRPQAARSGCLYSFTLLCLITTLTWHDIRNFSTLTLAPILILVYWDTWKWMTNPYWSNIYYMVQYWYNSKTSHRAIHVDNSFQITVQRKRVLDTKNAWFAGGCARSACVPRCAIASLARDIRACVARTAARTLTSARCGCWTVASFLWSEHSTKDDAVSRGGSCDLIIWRHTT